MLLSIIIPVYNVEPYLRECLNSIFSQDLTDCEVIAVNDGSTDGSRATLQEYKEKYPQIITVFDQANGGQGSARNLGAEYAQGDFFYFMDSDDYLKPHALISIKQAIAASEKADVIYFDCIVTDRGKRCGLHGEKFYPLMSFRSLCNYAYQHGIGIAATPVSYVYSSSYWRKKGLHYEGGLKYEDALFNYQLFAREDGTIKTVHVEEPFYVYRVGREGSTTTKLTLENFTDKQRIRKIANCVWKDNGIEDIAYYHMLFEESVYMFYEANTSGFIKQYRKYWDKEDTSVMRKGVSNKREYGLWLLVKQNPIWMARYYANDLPSFARRLTNVWLTVCTKRLYHNG